MVEENNNSQEDLDKKSQEEYERIVINPAKQDPIAEKESAIISDYAAKNVKGLTDELPEEFNVKNIGDLSYLLEIFSRKYDKYQSLDYLQKMRQNMIDNGYSDGSTLNEFLFWSAMSRKMQIIYQRMHAKINLKKTKNEDDAENLTFLKEMRAVSAQVASLQNSLDGALDKRKKVKDVVDLHAETMKDAEDFIKSHTGEFQFMCKKCGTIVDAQGLPHFAIMTEKDDKNEVVYHVFSPELWFLYRKGVIPLHYLALILRTSPEGILLTAEQRKEYGAKVSREDVKMLETEEELLKKLIKEYNESIGSK